MKIISLGAELLHADGQTDRQTDMTKLTVAFHKFAKATRKNDKHSLPFVSREETKLCYKTHTW